MTALMAVENAEYVNTESKPVTYGMNVKWTMYIS